MINLIKEENNYFLIIGFNTFTQSPKHKLLLKKEELVAISEKFINEDFAEDIANEIEPSWSFESLKLTNAPDHPYGYTYSGLRTILHYNGLSWHMITPEITLIGKLANELLKEDE